MKNRFAVCLILFALIAPARFSVRAQTTETPRTVEALPSFYEPAISPDREEIAFVSGGDIWTVPAAGGEARLLVSHAGTEARPIYSPDGRRLAFMSNRTGNMDIYVLTLDAGDVRRITYDDANDQLDAWSPDGRWLYFSSTSRDIAAMNDIYRVSSEGGTPLAVSADRYVNEFFAAPAPDNERIAFAARGISSAQWWRRGSSHIDQSEIWTRRISGDDSYQRVTEGGAREVWPMWSADGERLFYVSDRSGAQNLWVRSINGGRAPRQLTNFTDGRVLWANISYDGRAIVFERDFGIWRFDTSSNEATQVQIRRRGAPATPMGAREFFTNRFQEIALAPDGRKIAFTVRGEVFAASATDGGTAQRVTNTPENESEISWSPDSRRLVYVSDRGQGENIFLYDFSTSRETQLTTGTASDSFPRFSPDGRTLAFVRDGREIRALDMESRRERAVATGVFDRSPLNPARPFVWSPDNRFIAFFGVGNRSFRNVYVAPVEGGAQSAGRPVSFLANVFSNTLSWTADGKAILFDSSQRTEEGQLARIDLVPRTPRFREDQFRDLFREESPRTIDPNLRTPATPAPSPSPSPAASPSPAPSPEASPSPGGANATSGERNRAGAPRVEIVFEDIRRRLEVLPVGLSVIYHALSPDGKSAVVIAEAAGRQNLYIYPLDTTDADQFFDSPAIARQLTSTAGAKSFAQFSPDSKTVFYLEAGRVQSVPVDGSRPPRPLAVTADMDVDFNRERRAVFDQAWTLIRDFFYDQNYHGVNWATVRERYEPRIAGAGTPDEVRRLLQLMVGELNASHLGASAPGTGAPTNFTGRLGLRFDREEYERTGRLRITDILPLSPAALAEGVRIGDYLVAVDGTEITARTNLDELLNFKTYRRTVLTIGASGGADRREVALQPVPNFVEKGLMYRRWVEDNRAYVSRVSNNRLGYVHLFNMSSDALEQLYIDLDAENHAREGVVIDLRNNNGGFVNVYAIDVFARQSYFTMTRRDSVPSPARTQLGQRALEAPTILLTNQHSLSDAEDFTEGYRSLRLGRVVGEPTAGWIIYTTNLPLIDGTQFRLPFIRITANDGQNMELNPRRVDIPVSRTIGETYTGRDTQIDRAVSELLNQIGGGRNRARRASQ